MIKKIFLCLLAMLAIFLQADPVSTERAQKVALQWLQGHKGGRRGWAREAYILKVVPLTKGRKNIGYHVKIHPKGSIFVTADDYLPPVKCYSTSGTIDVKSCFGKSLMYELEGITHFAQTHKMSKKYQEVWNSYVQGRTRALSSRAAVGPLLASKWSQSAPYYNDCPIDPLPAGNGNRCVTGCVATAAAQIMRYWQHPARGTGTHTHNWTDSNGNVHALTVDFDTDYDYASMALTSPPNPSPALSKLMYHVGVALNMNYGTGASSASTSSVSSILKNYFKYKTTAYYTSRSGTDEEWFNKIKTEIDAQRPIQYRFSSSVGGHSVVWDGYELRTGPEYWVHINFGWAGSSDTWYNMNDIEDSVFHVTWNTGHAGVFGIEPSSDEKDAWDYTDDKGSGATLLEPTETEQPHGPHVLGREYYDDNDWYKIDMVVGTQYHFRSEIVTVRDLKNNRTDNDVYAELYSDSDGTTLVAEDDNSGGNNQFQFTYIPTTAGTYYLRVRMSNGGKWKGRVYHRKTGHYVNTPGTPTGSSTILQNVATTYTTTGTTCSQGHTVEYQFDWGDGNQSAWSTSTSATYTYTSTGSVNIKVKARCADDNTIESTWSGNKAVEITDHLVTKPQDPVGPSAGKTAEELTFETAGGSTCNQGHTVHYCFVWGDGSESDWSTSLTRKHTYTTAGTFQVKVKARCSVDTSCVSEESNSVSVTITKAADPVPDPQPDSGKTVIEDDDDGSNGLCGCTGLEFFLFLALFSLWRKFKRREND